MNIKYEFLNFITGVILVMVGIIEIFNKKLESAFSWIIFGSMYLVMDDYIPKYNPHGFTAKSIFYGRKIFSWIGLIFSVGLLLYIIL